MYANYDLIKNGLTDVLCSNVADLVEYTIKVLEGEAARLWEQVDAEITIDEPHLRTQREAEYVERHIKALQSGLLSLRGE